MSPDYTQLTHPVSGPGLARQYVLARTFEYFETA